MPGSRGNVGKRAAIDLNQRTLHRAQPGAVVDSRHLQLNRLAELLHLKHIADARLEFFSGRRIDEDFIRLCRHRAGGFAGFAGWSLPRLSAYLGRWIRHGTWYPDSVYGGAIFYAIHTIELMQELVGTDWSALRVEPGDEPVIHYETGRASVTLALRSLDPNGGSSAFGVGVTSPQLTCDKPIPLGNDYMAPVTDRIAAMLRSGNGMERETLLAPIRLMAEIEARLR